MVRESRLLQVDFIGRALSVDEGIFHLFRPGVGKAVKSMAVELNTSHDKSFAFE